MAAETNLSNQEIIDATQDAVLEAIGSVANVIESTAHELSAHEAVPFYQSAEFWVAFSFVLVVVLLSRPIAKLAFKKLVKRRNLIAKRIEDASNVYAEAQKMLASYERKYRQAKGEANEILAKAEREVALLKKDKLAKLENDMQNREREAKARIVAAQDAAVKEISVKTTGLAMSTVRGVLSQKISAKTQDKLIDESIALLANLK